MTRMIHPNVPVDEQKVSSYGNGLEPEDAVRIAREHFRKYAARVYNTEGSELDQHAGEACDLGDEWRIFFISDALKKVQKSPYIARLPRPNDDAPDYIIEKSSGKIIYFSNYGPSGSLVGL